VLQGCERNNAKIFAIVRKSTADNKYITRAVTAMAELFVLRFCTLLRAVNKKKLSFRRVTARCSVLFGNITTF